MNDQQANKYRVIIETIDDAVITKTLDGTITSWNPGAEKMFGYTALEMIGQPIQTIYPADRQHEFDEIMEVLRMGESIDHYPTIRKRKNDQLIDVSLSINPLKNQANQVEGAAVIIRDISQIKELERRKDSFIGMASHELKTPITTMKAFAQISQKMISQKNFTQLSLYLDKIEDQTSRLSELVNDLLDISKIQAGHLELHKTHYDLTAQIIEVKENIQQLYPSRTIIIKNTKQPKKAVINGDSDRIEQVLINLITNALKYSMPQKKVYIKIKLALNKITVGIQDFGIGISIHNLRKVFDRFFREEGDSEKTYPGLGIGLFVSSEIVKRHGGQIWVKSQKNKGSTFNFSLPLK